MPVANSKRSKTSFDLTEPDARASLALFCVAASSGKWKPYPHSVFLAEKIQAAMETPGSRLIISVPPRHGKTEASVVYGGAWYLKNNPGHNFGYIAHTQSLANEHSEKCRQVFEALPYGVPVEPASRGKEHWHTLRLAGGFVAAGVGGPITGKGFHCLVIDDPIKNQEVAYSKPMREKIWAYYTDTLVDRMAPGGSIILIMHRWHEDDLAGRLIAQGGWDLCSLPALAEENDPMGRSPGEALCPWMYDAAHLHGLKRVMGKAFDAKYQGKPRILSSGFFKIDHFRWFREEGDYYWLDEKRVRKQSLRIYQAIDPAGTDGKKSDYFVCLTFGLTPENELLVLNVRREKAQTTRHQGILEQEQKRFNPIYQAVEKSAYGLNLIQAARQAGRPLRPLIADSSKQIRAEPAVVAYENGAIWHRRDAPWLSEFEAEVLEFPNGDHDDQVDCIAYAVLLMNQGASFSLDLYDDLLEE